MKIGDTVKITDWGKCYSDYDDFLSINNISFDKWIAGRGIGEFMDEKYKITYIGNHNRVRTRILCVIENNNHKFIMEENGLQVVRQYTKQYR